MLRDRSGGPSSPAAHVLTWAPLSHSSSNQQHSGEDAQTQEVNYAGERRASRADGTWLIPALPLCSGLALAELYHLFKFQLPRLENEANNFYILNLEWKMEWNHGFEVLSWPWKEKKKKKECWVNRGSYYKQNLSPWSTDKEMVNLIFDWTLLTFYGFYYISPSFKCSSPRLGTLIHTTPLFSGAYLGVCVRVP